MSDSEHDYGTDDEKRATAHVHEAAVFDPPTFFLDPSEARHLPAAQVQTCACGAQRFVEVILRVSEWTREPVVQR